MYQKQQKGIINNELCFDSVQEEDDMQFGGYAPSLGGGSDGRPTTAPDKRSVRFADDLGFDINDNDDADKLLSQQSRPKTAPAKNNTTSDYLDSPLEKSMSRDLFDNKKNPRNKKNIFDKDEDEKRSTKENEIKNKINSDHNKKEGSSINSKSKKGINTFVLYNLIVLAASAASHAA